MFLRTRASAARASLLQGGGALRTRLGHWQVPSIETWKASSIETRRAPSAQSAETRTAPSAENRTGAQTLSKAAAAGPTGTLPRQANENLAIDPTPAMGTLSLPFSALSDSERRRRAPIRDYYYELKLE